MAFNNKKYTHPLYTKVTLYLRPNSPFWWCSLYQNGHQFRVSTKAKTQHDAEIFSGEWFIRKQAEILTGVIPERKNNLPTVGQASINGLDELWAFVQRGDRSERYYYGVVKYMNKHILPHFQEIPVEDVTPVVWYEFITGKYNENPQIARNTLHQMRNSLRLCLTAGLNAGWINFIPELKIKSSGGKSKPRVWFDKEEQEVLIKGLYDHMNLLSGTNHHHNAIELRDRVFFFLHSGLRVGELNNVRFKDIDIKKGEFTSYIMIRNITGKRGTGSCRGDIRLNAVLNSILEGYAEDTETPFGDRLLFKRHHREMFNVVLNKCNLKYDSYGRTRDFVSLRHTYICNKILDGKMTTQEIAVNCRTSSDMIYEHYAKWLAPDLMDSINHTEVENIKAKDARRLEVQKLKIDIDSKNDRLKLLDTLQGDEPELFNDGIFNLNFKN